MSGETELVPERDYLRMPYGEERKSAAGCCRASKNGISGGAGKPLVEQVLVRRASAEVFRVVGVCVAVPRLDEHQSDCWGSGGERQQAKIATVVATRPIVPDSTERSLERPCLCCNKSTDLRRGRLARLLFSEAMKGVSWHHRCYGEQGRCRGGTPTDTGTSYAAACLRKRSGDNSLRKRAKVASEGLYI